MFQCVFPPSSKEYGFLYVFKIIHHFLLKENMTRSQSDTQVLGIWGESFFIYTERF